MTKYWMPNPVETYFCDAFSAMIPAGEELFVAVAKAHRPYVPAELQARIDEFIAQEEAHTRAHTMHNKHYDLQCEYEDTHNRLYIAHRKPGMKLWLGAMVSIENIAAYQSRWFLRQIPNPSNKEQKLFAWHAREEIDHKSLAIDIWDARGFPRKDLRMPFVQNNLHVLGGIWRGVFRKLKADGILWKPKTLVQLLTSGTSWFLFAFVPSLSLLLPSFHPSKVDDSEYL